MSMTPICQNGVLLPHENDGSGLYIVIGKWQGGHMINLRLVQDAESAVKTQGEQLHLMHLRT